MVYFPLRLTKKEKSEKSRWILWTELMKRVFAEDVGGCVKCDGRMDLRAVMLRPPATIKVLTALVGRCVVENHLTLDWSRSRVEVS